MSVYFAEHDVVLHAGDALGGPGGCEAGAGRAAGSPGWGGEASAGAVGGLCYHSLLRRYVTWLRRGEGVADG